MKANSPAILTIYPLKRRGAAQADAGPQAALSRDPPLQHISAQRGEIVAMPYPTDIPIGAYQAKCPGPEGSGGKKKMEGDLTAFTPVEQQIGRAHV